MILLNVTFDTQRVSTYDLKTLLRDGQVLHAVGILNARREEFSALEVAQDAGLTWVAWDCVSDDTPGMLELTVWYPHVESSAIRQRVVEIDGVERWDVESSL